MIENASDAVTFITYPLSYLIHYPIVFRIPSQIDQ